MYGIVGYGFSWIHLCTQRCAMFETIHQRIWKHPKTGPFGDSNFAFTRRIQRANYEESVRLIQRKNGKCRFKEKLDRRWCITSDQGQNDVISLALDQPSNRTHGKRILLENRNIVRVLYKSSALGADSQQAIWIDNLPKDISTCFRLVLFFLGFLCLMGW